MSIQQQQQLDFLKKYINLFISRHKLIIGCVLLAVSAGIFLYLKTPKIYESTASINYQQQRINPSKFSPDEKTQIREMVNTMTQQVLSRTNLEKIIKEFDLYEELRKISPIEDVIEVMREKDVGISMQRDTGNVFRVSFRGRDPQKVMRVTNALSAKFIEENLRIREERASETTKYIKDELRMSKEVLGEKEALMRDFKMNHYNEMPDQRSANMSRLNALQQQLQAIHNNIQSKEQTRLLVSEQLELRNRLQGESTGIESGAQPLDALAQARFRLQELKARYTSEHPMVKRMLKRVEQLEAKRGITGGSDNEVDLNKSDTVDTPSAGVVTDPRISELSVQLQEIDLNLKTLQNEKTKVLNQMEKYQEWIDAAPVREAEWAGLTRDYEELKKYHDTLVAHSLSAEAAQSLEIRQKGSQFSVVDPAYLPKTPIKGNFLRFFLVSIGAGLAIGCGLVFGLDFLDTSFKDPREIETFLKVPATCTLPLIVTGSERKRSFLKNTGWYVFFTAWLLTLASATAYFWTQGNIII